MYLGTNDTCLGLWAHTPFIHYAAENRYLDAENVWQANKLLYDQNHRKKTLFY
jgi:hypothetical protein